MPKTPRLLTRNRVALGLLAAVSLASVGAFRAMAESPPRPLPAAAAAPAPNGLQTAVFAGGCFWGVQGVFSHVHGVTRAISGYSGGAAATANYELVSTGVTGHAESVQVTYDPKVVSYGELLRVFFSVALDPTEVNRQGPDSGSQYRSALFVANPEQKAQAAAYIAQLNRAHVFKAPIATQVTPLKGFVPAEAYHQDFLALHPDHPYIQGWDMEKVTALKTLYPALYSGKRATGV